MTNQERIKAFKMRLQKTDWPVIADELGYSEETVKRDLIACVLRGPRTVNCIYPNLRRVITDEYGGSVRAFALAIGTPSSTLYHVLPGKGKPAKKTAETIASGAGLTEEEAFYREE